MFFLPPNATSVCQPLDQGIIKSWKSQYRREWVQYVVDEAEHDRDASRSVTVLHAIRWGILSWHQNVSTTTIKNCWLKARVLPSSSPLVVCTSDLQKDSADQRDVLASIGGALQELGKTTVVDIPLDTMEFVNPEGEVVEDSDEDVLEAICACYGIRNEQEQDYETDEEEVSLPKMKVKEAISLAGNLGLFEEQQEDADPAFLKMLQAKVSVWKARETSEKHQKAITDFFS